jgi:hypothetical protein
MENKTSYPQAGLAYNVSMLTNYNIGMYLIKYLVPLLTPVDNNEKCQIFPLQESWWRANYLFK